MTVDLTMALLPDQTVREQLISWSRTISQRFDTRFVLGNKLQPHVTIYQARFPDSAHSTITTQLAALASVTSVIPIYLNQFSSFAGVLFFDAVKSIALQKLHQTIVLKLSPLRQGLLLPIHNELLTAEIAESKKFSIRTWGNPMCMNEYDPHISITRLTNVDQTLDALAVIEPKSMTFTADRFVVGTVGSDGTLPTILNDFPLAS